MNPVLLNMDAFSDGQMGSKLWLCENLEKTLSHESLDRLFVFGSWYGLLPWMLLVRDRLRFQQLILCDINSEALEISKKVLDHWRFKDLPIRYQLGDCSEIANEAKARDLVINTSCEHMKDLSWWHQLSHGTFFALQSTDMIHPEHINPTASIEEWKEQLGPLQDCSYSGQMDFHYPAMKFHRWMLIGRK